MITIMTKKEYDSIMLRRTLEDSDIIFVPVGIINGIDTYKMVKNRYSTQQNREMCKAEALNIIDAYLRITI
jgi:hypothetical protein